MKTINLRPVAITDLSMRWARSMGGNKIRHYRLPYAAQVLNDKPITELLKEYIEKEEGGPVELVFEGKQPPKLEEIEKLTPGLPIQIEDISSYIFGDGKNRDVKKSLNKLKVNSLIWVTEDLNSPKRAWNRVAFFVNSKILSPINRLLAKLQGKGPDEWAKGDYPKLLKYVPLFYGMRIMHLVHFLAVSFEKSQMQEAAQALMDDLRILQNHKLILGNLAPPSLIRLADTIGAGEEYFAMLCFPLIDSIKLQKLLNVSPIDMPTNPLQKLLVKYSTPEGDTKNLGNQSFESKWDIETVDVLGTAKTFDQVRDEYIDSYLKSVEHVNKAAAKMEKAIESTEKSDSEK